MKKHVIVSTLIGALMLTACGRDSATKGVLKSLNSSYDYDGKEVELVGYIAIASGRAGGALVTNGKIAVGLVNSSMQQKQDAFAEASINFGQDINSLWIPEKFQLSDVEVYDANGKKFGINTKFAFKAMVHYTNKEWAKATEESQDSRKMQFGGLKSEADKAAEAKAAAEERKKKTGDPNDYSFRLIITSISKAP
ncbi:MAG: hypothetical protein LBD28_05665 [Tannerellaceae bacterium]|jgi:hypothetical protein|nr:hypothetical protein [Tannerellaceae bacterium]